MKKEDILTLLQSQILALRDRGSEIEKDPRLKLDFIEKTKTINNAMESLSAQDTKWLDDQYAAFYDKEIKPFKNKK